MKAEHIGSVLPQSEVFCVKYNSDGNYVMSGHADRTVRLWNSNLSNQ
jgi:WD40 repeat protein